MRTRGHLRGFSESVEKTKEDLYIPGGMSYPPMLVSMEESKGAPEIIYNKPWTYPKRVKGFTETGLVSYKPKGAMRRAAKERVYSKLRMLPDDLQASRETNPGTYDMPQFPLYFLDGVPNFDEVPFGAGNYYNQDFGEGPEVGDWGNLISSLSKGVSDVLEMERQKYLAQVKASQTVTPPVKPIIPGTSSNFLLYAIIGGGALLLLLKK